MRYNLKRRLTALFAGNLRIFVQAGQSAASSREKIRPISACGMTSIFSPLQVSPRIEVLLVRRRKP
jgi:hypothetical protein